MQTSEDGCELWQVMSPRYKAGQNLVVSFREAICLKTTWWNVFRNDAKSNSKCLLHDVPKLATVVTPASSWQDLCAKETQQ